MAGIKLEGLDELRAKLDELASARYIKAILRSGAAELMNYMAVYPPESIANNSGARNWYERGRGSFWRRRDGSIGSAMTSETLGRRWTMSVGSTRATVGNNASYGPWVQSAKKQTQVHKRRGWRTDAMAFRDIGPKIIALAKQAVERILRA